MFLNSHIKRTSGDDQAFTRCNFCRDADNHSWGNSILRIGIAGFAYSTDVAFLDADISL